MFNEHKVTHMAAFFLGHAHKNTMPHLKLIKLLYLAERKAIQDTGYPMCGDKLVSMPHGPVLSNTLNLMNGDTESKKEGWKSWIAPKADNQLSLSQPFDQTALKELSDSDIAILTSIWSEFGGMGKYKIRDWTHKHCPEWEDPQGSSRPISYKKLLQKLGFDKATTDEIVEQIEEQENISQFFSTL